MEEYNKLWADLWGTEAEIPGPSRRHGARLIEGLIARYDLLRGGVLDAGCGSGEQLRRLHAKAPSVAFSGIDISKEAVDIARKRVGSFANLRTADLTDQSTLPDGPFDLIVCSEVLEHIPDDSAAFASLYNLCWPGGHVVVTVPHGPQYWTHLDESVGHVRRYTSEGICSSATQIGFEVVESFTWGFPIYSAYYNLVLSRLSTRFVSQRRGLVKRVTTNMLSTLLYFDDLFKGSLRGRRLICLFRRPLSQPTNQALRSSEDVN